MKKTSENNRGITLIALVITIIVLLILAGVSISMLTGQNGILLQASNASRETEIASVKEQAQLDISNWVAEELKNGREGKINDWEDIKMILNEANTDEENRYYVEVTQEGVKTLNGYIVPIEELYTNSSENSDFDANELIIGTAINTDKYGQKVTKYAVQTSEMSTNVWRLFYQDNNYTYLITDECMGSYKPIDYYSSYTDGSMVSTIGQKLNPMLSEAGRFFVETNTSSNIRTTAWLTDTSKTGMWNEYKNEDAVFAIGGPTIELYVSSFNATASANEATVINLELGTYGYNDNAVVNQLQTSYNYGIYNKSSSSYWWIASPDSSSNKSQQFVSGTRGFFSNGTEVTWNSVRPIVCIPTSIFNSKYLSSLE